MQITLSDAPLAGRAALVCGAAAPAAVRAARRLARQGARVVLTDPDPAALDHAARQLGPRTECRAADLSRSAEVDALAGRLAALGGCAVLIHAGPQGPGGWEAGFLSPLRVARAVVPQMLRAGAGRILFLSPPEGQADDRPRAALDRFAAEVAQLYAARGLEVAALPPPAPPLARVA